jgi:hypothetical protein
MSKPHGWTSFIFADAELAKKMDAENRAYEEGKIAAQAHDDAMNGVNRRPHDWLDVQTSSLFGWEEECRRRNDVYDREHARGRGMKDGRK